MEIMDEMGCWNTGLGTRLSARFEGNRQERKKHAKLRGRSGGALRAQSVTIRRAVRDEQKAATMMCRLKQHLGLLEEQQVWGRGFKIRGTKTLPVRSKSKAKKVMAGGSRSLPAYRKPLIDKRGRIALFMAISYVGLGSAKWRSGIAADHVHYISRADAIELAAAGAGIISNMGLSTGEIAQGWQALEEVEKAYRANAIVQHRFVVNLPDGLSPVGRERVLTDFCKKSFGRYGLPYIAVPHLPDPGGNRRNFHGHVCISARPMQRTGDYEWMIGEEKISGFTDPVSLKRIRAEFAAVLNRECRRERLEVRFTHQNYKERGTDARRQEHYGPERTALHRNGHAVNMVARNQARVERNETKLALGVVNMAAEAATKFEELIRRRLALLDRRKMLRRRMKVIDGVLTLVDDVSEASGIGSKHRPATLESINVKRLAVTDTAQRFERLNAGNGTNHQRRHDARRATLKGPFLAKIDKHIATFVTKASSPNYLLPRLQARLVGKGINNHAILAKLLAIMSRQATVAVWRARAVAIRDSAGQLVHESTSIRRENSSNTQKIVSVVGVTPASTNLVGANQARPDTSISASVAVEKAAVSAADDPRDYRSSIEQGGDQSANKSNISGVQAGKTPTVRKENSTVEPSARVPTPRASDPSITGHEKLQSETKPSRDDASFSEMLVTTVPIGGVGSLPNQPMTKEEIRDILKPRRVGPDGIFHIVEPAVAKPKNEGVSGSKAATVERSAACPSGSDVADPQAQQNSAPSPFTTTVPSATVAPTIPQADEHDRLITRFERAHTDEERHSAAMAIRADKIAFQRIIKSNNPQWIIIDTRYREDQRIAAIKGSGKGE